MGSSVVCPKNNSELEEHSTMSEVEQMDAIATGEGKFFRHGWITIESNDSGLYSIHDTNNWTIKTFNRP